MAAGLSEADHRLATELVMGVLRWRGELDFWIASLAQRRLETLDPEILAILRLGVYQIRFLTKIPKRAAVDEAVRLAKRARKRSAAGFVNAVLRKCEPPGGASFCQQLEAARRSLPPWLLARWKEHFGAETADRLALASVAPPRVTLRLTLRVEDQEKAQEQLAAEGLRTRPAGYAARALIVDEGRAGSAELVRDRRAVIQDEGSQLVIELLGIRPGQRVLDLCAAPGMKTAQMAEELGSGMLVAADLSARRLRAMTRLVRETMPPGVIWAPIRLDASQPLPFTGGFERVLVDAPCSGTGTLARHPEIKWRLQPEDLPRLAALQISLLANAFSVLAPGGRLVYATCSLEPEENEGVVERALANQNAARLGRSELAGEFPALAPLFDADGYFRTRPDRDRMDGFFAAVIEKRSS